MTEDSHEPSITFTFVFPRNHPVDNALRDISRRLGEIVGQIGGGPGDILIRKALPPISYSRPFREMLGPEVRDEVLQVPEDILGAAKKANEQVLKKARMHQIKLLKRDQCNKCQFHCDSEHLNCAVNPTFLNDLEQETCGHYEEEIIIEDSGKCVHEDDLSVRARLQALGYSIEDFF